MKRLILVVNIALALAIVSWAAFQVASSTVDPPMSRLMPQDAVVYLEAKDLGGLLQEWNASPEKQAWLKSDNYEVFSRSRLLGRLEQAQSEFASAAGVPPDAKFLEQVAGHHSAIAIYDIGKLELLYISRVPSAKSLENALWQNRAKFEPRESAGKKFYVRAEPESGRVVAFAVDGDYLILGTREDLVAGTLSLLAGQKLATLHEQNWFAEALKTAKEPGDLRLLVHLAEVTKTPQFCTYWIQQNITDLRQYESSISDLYRTTTEYREERALLLKSVPDQNAVNAAAENSKPAADLFRLTPPAAGFYRVSAAPSADETLNVLESKVLTPRTGPAPPETLAPTSTLSEGTVGSMSDLEARIDLPPSAPKPTGKSDEALKALLTKANVRALLQLHRSEPAADGIFINLRSTVVLSSASDWDEQGTQSILQGLLAPGLSAGQLGVTWNKVGRGVQAYSALSGLNPLLLAVRGKYLVVGNDRDTMTAVLARFSQKATTEPVIYAAGFDHERERQNFYRLTSLVDRPSRMGTNGSDVEPQFFSQNVASLSKVFEGLKSQSIVVRRNGGVETQTVRYEWAR